MYMKSIGIHEEIYIRETDVTGSCNIYLNMRNLLDRARPDEDISEADVTGRWRPVIGLRKAP